MPTPARPNPGAAPAAPNAAAPQARAPGVPPRAAPPAPARATSAKPVPPPAAPTGAQLAMAFSGKPEPARASLLYRLAILPVVAAMVLLPVVYLGIIAAAAAGACWYATHASVMFSVVRGGRAVLLVAVVYVAPLIAGGFLVLFMVLPLFWKSRKRERPMWVGRSEQPLLYAYVDQLCDTMRAPRPERIDVIAMANASARIDNGLAGLLRRRLVLTVGLPLAGAMDLRPFTAVLAHELGHFSQGGSMRLSYVVARINNWFARMAWGRSGVDDMIDAVVGNDSHWTMALIGAVSKLALWLARLVLKGMALVSHFLSMHLSRQAEYDADCRAARVVGGGAMAAALEALPNLDASGDFALVQARAGWGRRTLPDDLVELTAALWRDMPEALKEKVTAKVLTEEEHWSDTHPPLFKRVVALKKAGMRGVMTVDGPATCLFRDFDELCKMATIDLYQSILGQSLRPKHLVPTPAAVAALRGPRPAGRSLRPR